MTGKPRVRLLSWLELALMGKGSPFEFEVAIRLFRAEGKNNRLKICSRIIKIN